MMDALEIPTPEIIEGKKRMILRGEFVCHEDILGTKIGNGWNDSFTVCGEENAPTYMVGIMFIE